MAGNVHGGISAESVGQPNLTNKASGKLHNRFGLRGSANNSHACNNRKTSTKEDLREWIVAELECIRMDDYASTLRKERWLEKVESWVGPYNSESTANPPAVVLYNLDAEDPRSTSAAQTSNNRGGGNSAQELWCRSKAGNTAPEPMSPKFPTRDSAVVEEGISVEARTTKSNGVEEPSSHARDVIRRLTNVVAKHSMMTAEPSAAHTVSPTSTVNAIQAATTRQTGRSDANQKWFVKARLRVQDFEANTWCISAVQCFTLMLSMFELSQVCTENVLSVKDEMCLALNSIDMVGNFFFVLEVVLYIAIFPWKFLCKSAYFWIDVVAFVTYYTRVVGGWSFDENPAIEFLSISIPLLRILKITRRSKSWRLLVMALWRSLEPISVPALFLTLVVSIFSGLLYWVEKQAAPPGEPPAFESIPHAIWFSIVTVSTTGYGDVTPHTDLGKLVCILLIGVGVCCFAMPLAVVGNCFCSVWDQRDVILLAERLKRLFSVAGVTFADLQQLFDATDVDGSGDMELNEFIGFFRMLKLDIGRRDIVKFFQMMDVAGNGKVTFEEFREHLGMCQAVESGRVPNRSFIAECRSPQMFGRSTLSPQSTVKSSRSVRREESHRRWRDELCRSHSSEVISREL